MTQQHIEVGIVVERRAIDSPWADHAWAPLAVLPEPPPLAPWTELAGEAGRQQFYLGPATLTLHSVDTAHFRENFQAGHAKLWVAIRPTGIEPEIEFVGVTADPFEGEVYCENVGDVVEALPMPLAVAEAVLAFFEAHHVEREFIKRKRSEHDPRKGGAPRPGPGLPRGEAGPGERR
ncbi:MAG TPA: DUF3305 domain-containing protein [Bosea sp. (in: a-proteobacteria)]|jgi:hypothetical protein|uniref:DUF3305 domain-containing protein n=1 Tax=Bosea sp. (in: a-proteobacteria) TaxID=1871050 RepID=UPI002DDC9D9E|nr:DUF3305 domain-containing protein [Bosea sp. (in: a-proteobacteria)]HEV2554006.1 DUF3305 domain-containing protein [Bosea sp. (in: a-proteobacteria)]